MIWRKDIRKKRGRKVSNIGRTDFKNELLNNLMEGRMITLKMT